MNRPLRTGDAVEKLAGTAGASTRRLAAPSVAPDQFVGTEAEFQRLMIDHSGLVHNIAWQLHRRWRTCVDKDDLVQAGYVGLAQAIRRFRPGRAEFSTFAYERIRGEMRDFLRRQPWYRFRSVAEHTRDMADEVLADTTIDAVDGDPGGRVDGQEWFRSSVRRLALVRWVSSTVAHGALDSACSDEGDGPEAEETRRELVALIRRCVDELPIRDAEVIHMTYFEGLTFEDAGARLGVHKSTVSRMHAKILDTLAARLRDSMLLEGASR